MFVIVTIIREKGETYGRHTPTGIQIKQSSSRSALAHLRWYIDAVVSRPEIDLHTEHSRSHHDVVSTVIHIKRRAVGAIFVEDTTSFVGVDGRVAVGTDGSSVIGLFQRIDSEYEFIRKIETYPECDCRCGSGGI